MANELHWFSKTEEGKIYLDDFELVGVVDYKLKNNLSRGRPVVELSIILDGVGKNPDTQEAFQKRLQRKTRKGAWKDGEEGYSPQR